MKPIALTTRRPGWRRALALAVLALLCLEFGPARALEPAALLKTLRDGGLVIYFRHAQTDWGRHDQVRSEGDWSSCDPGRMRQLSDTGRRTARSVGAAMRQLEVPVHGLFASEYCRCVETARLLDLAPVQTTRDILNARAAQYLGGRDALERTVRERLSTPPPAGTNTVLVAHGNVWMLVGDRRPPEAGAVVVRPLGQGRFEVLGTLSPRQWLDLAEGE